MDSHQPTLYQWFGVPETATPNEIRRAWHKHMQRHHPDKGGDVELAKEINRIYGILSDQQERTTYDAWLATQRAPKKPTHQQQQLFFSTGGITIIVSGGSGNNISFTY